MKLPRLRTTTKIKGALVLAALGLIALSWRDHTFYLQHDPTGTYTARWHHRPLKTFLYEPYGSWLDRPRLVQITTASGENYGDVQVPSLLVPDVEWIMNEQGETVGAVIRSVVCWNLPERKFRYKGEKVSHKARANSR